MALPRDTATVEEGVGEIGESGGRAASPEAADGNGEPTDAAGSGAAGRAATATAAAAARGQRRPAPSGRGAGARPRSANLWSVSAAGLRRPPIGEAGHDGAVAEQGEGQQPSGTMPRIGDNGANGTCGGAAAAMAVAKADVARVPPCGEAGGKSGESGG
mmetsp:Transcript_104055/g.269383  ORF Transcript_104055/g.269383 Transcript_104055/m.269383 type:complete len:159 (+) Transcript_104055:1699-2175(+)